MLVDWLLSLCGTLLGFGIVVFICRFTIRNTLAYRLLVGSLPGIVSLCVLCIMFGMSGGMRHWQVYPLYCIPAAVILYASGEAHG